VAALGRTLRTRAYPVLLNANTVRCAFWDLRLHAPRLGELAILEQEDLLIPLRRTGAKLSEKPTLILAGSRIGFSCRMNRKRAAIEESLKASLAHSCLWIRRMQSFAVVGSRALPGAASNDIRER
jgi:hypothetical protein